MNISFQEPGAQRQSSWESRMAGSPASSPVTEKPFHYTYVQGYKLPT